MTVAELEQVCPRCQGLGVLRSSVPIGHRDFGKLRPCENVLFHADETLRKLFDQSGLLPHERYELDDLVQLDEHTVGLVTVMRTFLAEPKGWVYLWGGFGTGKTTALMAAVCAFIEKGTPAYYTTFADLLSVMIEAFKPPQPGEQRNKVWQKWRSYDARFSRMQNIPLLAIDEFDTSKINETQWVSQFRGQLVDHRYRDGIHEGGTVTLFAGNEDPKRLPLWIRDRIEDGRFVVYHHEGESVRKQLKWYIDK